MSSKEIKVHFSEEDLQDMMRGKEFHWEFEGVALHLFKGEEEWDWLVIELNMFYPFYYWFI